MMWQQRACGIGDEAAADLPSQVAAHVELGMSAIELRTVDGRPVHTLGEPELRSARAQLDAAGLRCAVIDSPIGNWASLVTDPLEPALRVLERNAAAAHLLGTRYVRVMSFPNDGLNEREWGSRSIRHLCALATVAAQLDVVLLHENCSGWAGQGHTQTLRLLESVGLPSLRLVFDLGNGLEHGYDPVRFLRHVLPWVVHVHVKDGLREPDGVRYVPPGLGQARVAECIELLEGAGYTGYYSLEPHVARVPHEGRTATAEQVRSGYHDCARALQVVLSDRTRHAAAEPMLAAAHG